MYDSAWYAYGTFMGESITRDTKSEKATALRIAIGVWILYCLIISNSYGGSLKAFLTSPQRTNPIDTLEQVIDSELPWEMCWKHNFFSKSFAEFVLPSFTRW